MRAVDEGTHFSVCVFESDLLTRNIPGPAMRFRFSTSDGRLIHTDPEQPPERNKGELTRLVVEARQCGATYINSARHLLLNRLTWTYLEHCWNHPEAVVLLHLRTGYEALMQHAITVANALKLPLGRRLNTPMCAIPDTAIKEAVTKLEKLGHKVVLAEYEGKPAGQA